MLEYDEEWVESFTEEVHNNSSKIVELLEYVLFELNRCPNCAKLLSSYKMREPHGEILNHFVCSKCGEL